jgi:hypothetical protein
LLSRRGWVSGGYKGIPRVIFICAGHNNGGSTFVVTTSQDDWFGYTRISLWAHENRLWYRPISAPITNAPAMSVNRLSLQLFNNYNAVQAHANAAPNPAAVSAIRLQVINAWRGIPANFANHANEVFTPLGYPGFEIKARCLRCQAMFHYNLNVAPNLVNLERAWRSRKAPLNHLCQRRFICAETIGHFYCMLARGTAATH